MGAFAPVISSWITEDDLLLKNAIEAGALLESLAKGAVQFSRKFTVLELHIRWHSLLYDPVVSEEASSHIIESERSASTLSSKFGSTGNSKGSKSFCGKRKSGSVRSCYYALRKRIQSEPFDSMDQGFLIAPNDSNYVRIEDKPLPGNCMLGNPISDHFEVQKTNMDIMHCSFPQILADDGAATRDGCTTGDFQTTIHKQDDDGFPAEPVNVHEELPNIIGENQFLVVSGTGIDVLHESKQLPVHSLSEDYNLMAKPSSTFDQSNNDQEKICSEFEGNQVFSSPIVESGLSIWRTDESLCASAIPADDGHGENDVHGRDIYALPGNIVAKSDHASGDDVVGTDSKLKSEILCEELENPVADTEAYLVEITNTLMSDEPFFMDVDAKDVIDKSYFGGLSSLLVSSPNNCDQGWTPDVTELMTSGSQVNLAKMSCSGLGELDEVTGSCTLDGPASCNSEVLMLSFASTSNSQFPELTNSIICCTLNTEDPEIPSNEDVGFGKQLCPLVSSSTQQIFEVGNPLSACVKDLSGGQKTSGGGSLLVHRDKNDIGQSHGSSQMKGSQVTLEMGQLHRVVKCDESPCVAPRSDGFLANGLAQINSRNVSESTLPLTPPKEKGEEIILGMHQSHSAADSLVKEPALCSDSHNSYPVVNSSATKQEVDVVEMIKDHQASSSAMGSMDIISPESVIDRPPPDLEGLLIERDDDAPYSSDIEAMILDMDLDPDDQDLFYQEVARYEHEETKRAVIRMEQAFHSYMQRAIASHGAFAILYGRCSKHYIKKPEVILGRTTEDFIVDIDLGREGCANKVSRRQAIINVEEDGSFHLKNLGKCSVSINSKEVAPGQSLSLNSGCLIEIMGMPFIFETNQTCVKQYLNGVATRKLNSEAPCTRTQCGRAHLQCVLWGEMDFVITS